MTKIEKSILTFVEKNIHLVIILFSTLLSLYIRYSLRNFITPDIEYYFAPWFEDIKANGGLLSLSKSVADNGEYNLPYQIIIAFMTYLPIKAIHANKILSTLCDYLLAGFSAQIIWNLSDKNKIYSSLTYALILCFPMVFLNSAMWGQIDSVYVLFCIIAFYCTLKKKYTWCWIAFGVAISIKLQAIFLLPLLVCLYFKKRDFSIWKIVFVPVMMLLMSSPALIQGRPIRELVSIYYEQADQCRCLSLSYPSFWNIFFGNANFDYYDSFHGIAIGSALFVLMIIFVYVVKRESLSTLDWMIIAFLCSYACVLFLPTMHDRYDYLPIIFGLMIAVMDRKSIPFFTALSIINLIDYSDYLFHTETDWRLLGIINTIVFISYVIYFLGNREALDSDKPSVV